MKVYEKFFFGRQEEYLEPSQKKWVFYSVKYLKRRYFIEDFVKSPKVCF